MELFYWPIRRRRFPGYELVEYVRFRVQPPARSAGGGVLHVGAVVDAGRTIPAIRWPFLCATYRKRALVAGVTGSGENPIPALASWSRCGMADAAMPFLGRGVQAKAEYRNLAHLPGMEGLKIFTVGDETVAPLRINPFEVPRGILVQTHIDYLKSLFSAAFVLYPPMPYVLEQSLREVYIDRGWDLARNANQRGASSVRRFPTLSDLVAKVDSVVDRMDYDERISRDTKAALMARLGQLRSGGGKGPMLDTRLSIPANVLFGTPCILELKDTVDDDEKAFIIGLILVRLYEYYEGRANPPATHLSGLSHVTLIEEAHRLLRNVSTEQGSEVSANPKAQGHRGFRQYSPRKFAPTVKGFSLAEQGASQTGNGRAQEYESQNHPPAGRRGRSQSHGQRDEFGRAANAFLDNSEFEPGRRSGLRRGNAATGAGVRAAFRKQTHRARNQG